jgi:hypothetical protein
VPDARQLQDVLLVAAKGAAAGVVATGALTVAMQLANRLFAHGGTAHSSGSAEAPQDPPTERLAARLVNLVSGADPSPRTRRGLGMLIHWAYGTLWGVLYGFAHRRLRSPTWAEGTFLGVMVWLIGPMGLIPAMNLFRRPSTAQPLRRAISILLHQIYGWTAAATFRAFTR